MLRIVKIILVLTILTTQSAWAINGNALSNGAGSGTEIQQTYTQTEDQHGGAAESCCHFCHASGHLVGIFSNINLDIAVASDRHTSKLIDFASSIKYQPPTPPPTV